VPQYAAALHCGRLLLKLDKTEEALEYLTRAVEVGPELALTHEQLGRAHSYAGDLEPALRWCYSGSPALRLCFYTFKKSFLRYIQNRTSQ